MFPKLIDDYLQSILMYFLEGWFDHESHNLLLVYILLKKLQIQTKYLRGKLQNLLKKVLQEKKLRKSLKSRFMMKYFYLPLKD